MKKKQSHTRNEIVKQLITGSFCSGEQLGQMLGISRAGVAKHIKALQELGLDIYSVTGKGYKLAHPIGLFDKTRLLKELIHYSPEQLHVLHVIDSTNDYLKLRLQDDKHGSLPNGLVCLAEAQTAGRGRQGKKWVSPFGSSLYCSMLWQFEGGYQSISGLSLAVGLAVVRAVQSLGVTDVGLKWPNDVYAQGKKLAGILIDVEGHMHGSCQCIIGIGVNVALPGNVTDISQPWVDLQLLLGCAPDKNSLAGSIIQQLNQVLSRFEQTGLPPFVDEWNQLDIYQDKEVKLLTGNNAISGIGKGIDDTGAIKLEMLDEAGNVVTRSFFGGEISVRPA